ncbi:hypothetical protein E8F11_28195 [Pseudomonas sp. BN417]|nr:hypothetical protein [Pseudomonas sp. BN417]
MEETRMVFSSNVFLFLFLPTFLGLYYLCGARYRNLLLTMLLGGLWHGANFTFVLWGAWHGFWLAMEGALGVDAAPLRFSPLKWVVTFLVVILGWVLFRSESLQVATLVIAYASLAFFGLHDFHTRPLAHAAPKAAADEPAGAAMLPAGRLVAWSATLQRPLLPMLKYLQTDAFRDSPPQLVIWEFPERYLPMAPDLSQFDPAWIDQLEANGAAGRSLATQAD